MTSPLKGIYINKVAYIAVPVAYMAELLEAHRAQVTLPAINDELAQMAADLGKFRAGLLPPFVVFGSETCDALEANIAAERDMDEQYYRGWMT